MPNRRRNEPKSRLYQTDKLSELLDMQAETAGWTSEHMASGALQYTDELLATAQDYEFALEKALEEIVEQWPPEDGSTAEDLMVEGEAPVNVFLTLAGHGAGIWDGRWDEYFDQEAIDKITKVLKKKLGGDRGYVSDSGSGMLLAALDNAVYAAESRAGIERNEDNEIIEREENRRRRPRQRQNGMTPWVVWRNRQQMENTREPIDVVYYSDDMDELEVKRALIGEGYDDRIFIMKRERRHTRAPDMLATNSKGRTRKKVVFRVRGTADDHRDRHMMLGRSSRTIKMDLDTEPDAMRAFEKFRREQAPVGREAKVWIEKSWPSGDFSVLAKVVGENGRWVPGFGR